MRISDWSSDVCSSDLDPQLVRRRVGFGGEGREHVVIIDDAVLEDLDEARALVRMRGLQHLGQVLVDVDPARHEPRARAERERARPPRAITRPESSEERPCGEECVRTCRSRWSTFHTTKIKQIDMKYIK